MAVESPLPAWIEPMAATLTRESEWVFEQRLDDIRVLAFKQAQEVRLFSRNQVTRES